MFAHVLLTSVAIANVATASLQIVCACPAVVKETSEN